MISVQSLRSEVAYWLRHRRVRAMAMACGAGLALNVAVLAYWLPQARHHDQLGAQVDQARRDLLILSRADEIQGSYRHAVQALQTVNEKLAQTASQARLVESIDQVARRLRVRIVSQAYEELREQNGVLPLQANLTLQGGYPALRAMTRDLPELPAWCVIQEARFEPARDQTAEIKAQIRLACFRSPGGQAPKAVAG